MIFVELINIYCKDGWYDNMNLKKFLASALVLCTTTFVANTAFAANVEITKDFFKQWKNGTITIFSMADKTKTNLHFENAKFSVNILPIYQGQYAWSLGSIRKYMENNYSDAVYCASQAPLGGNATYITIAGLELEITNKTDQVLFIDLNKSTVSIGKYYGRPLPGGVKYNESQTAMLPPMIIPPKATMKKEVNRGDYVFVAAGANSAWVLPPDFVLDENVLGAGYYVLAMGEKDPELVSFQMSCVIPKSSFDKYLKPAKNKKK